MEVLGPLADKCAAEVEEGAGWPRYGHNFLLHFFLNFGFKQFEHSLQGGAKQAEHSLHALRGGDLFCSAGAADALGFIFLQFGTR